MIINNIVNSSTFSNKSAGGAILFNINLFNIFIIDGGEL
ncbi:hypothetical protein MBBAR_33c00020 [Methanobrevibacter arboriphilus JCM 13429 = DSM 1125]|uniref:Uncharacterized protein n=1 Tax=Methanobrevibacter arboriphilus JCM 13429 = DSM 1125 TaxID=1300164 RepID=A0A1V6N010_METAZ|nr:hypothetical protein MBBAR_33c00020 [Methanobrevibacter arboriphilus JCM 13429 = DSM 1125]